MGLSKSVKTIIKADIPDLKKYEDISDFIIRGAFASESDVEDMDSKVELPETSKKTSRPATEQRAVKLVELGPRLSLRLTKIQDGLCDGEIVHHEFIVKTEEEIKELKIRKKQQRELKEKRKLEQQRNVQAKKEANKKNKKAEGEEGNDDDDDEIEEEEEEEVDVDMDDVEEDMYEEMEMQQVDDDEEEESASEED
jgi:ribosome biogenesis protein SSF1/2